MSGVRAVEEHQQHRLETTVTTDRLAVSSPYLIYVYYIFTRLCSLDICSVVCPVVVGLWQGMLLFFVLLIFHSLLACFIEAFHLYFHINFERENRLGLNTSSDTFVSRQECPFHYLSNSGPLLARRRDRLQFQTV